MQTQTQEKICVNWHLNFVAEIRNGVVERAYFTNSGMEENIISDFSQALKKRLLKYFKGKNTDFDDVTVIYPTEFSMKVLQFVRKIPFGKVLSYSQTAQKVGTSPRAVGVALRANLVPVIVPCHRVIGRNGIGGYSAGTEIKKLLLELEGIDIK